MKSAIITNYLAKMTPNSAIKSICILRLSAIGDVCHAVATVQQIQKNYPAAEITWVLGKVEAMLLADLPGVNFVIFDKKQGVKAYKKLKRDLPQTFDVLLHMQVALRANIAAMCIKAKRKIGFPKHLSKELHSLAVNEHTQAQAQPHVLEGFQAFAHAIGVEPFEPSWDIPISEADMTWAKQQLNTQSPIFVIAAAASKAERNWSAKGYAEIANYAAGLGFQVVLTGGPTQMEVELASDIATFTNASVVNLVGQSNLKQLLALLKLADVVLAPDTGPAHMAVTQGTPVVGLYAHSNPKRTGPYTCLEYVVEVYQQHVTNQFGKTTAELKWGTRVKGSDLMQDISVDAVKQTIDKLISDKQINTKVKSIG